MRRPCAEGGLCIVVRKPCAEVCVCIVTGRPCTECGVCIVTGRPYAEGRCMEGGAVVFHTHTIQWIGCGCFAY